MARNISGFLFVYIHYGNSKFTHRNDTKKEYLTTRMGCFYILEFANLFHKKRKHFEIV